MKNSLLTLLTTCLASVVHAEPISIPENIGMQNQNIDIRLSDNDVLLNYDFRIPNQRVYSYNSLLYSEKDHETTEFTTGVILREPTGYGSRLSVGATLSALNVEEFDMNGVYMSVYLGLSDSNRRAGTLYYNVSGSVSPNIVSFGDVDNVYKAKGELGVHLTAGSVIYAGYNYLNVESDKIEDSDLVQHPFVGVSINF